MTVPDQGLKVETSCRLINQSLVLIPECLHQEVQIKLGQYTSLYAFEGK